jgi:hypothetical protein
MICACVEEKNERSNNLTVTSPYFQAVAPSLTEPNRTLMMHHSTVPNNGVTRRDFLLMSSTEPIVLRNKEQERTIHGSVPPPNSEADELCKATRWSAVGSFGAIVGVPSILWMCFHGHNLNR